MEEEELSAPRSTDGILKALLAQKEGRSVAVRRFYEEPMETMSSALCTGQYYIIRRKRGFLLVPQCFL